MSTALLETIGRELARASLVATLLVGAAAGVLALLRGLAPRWRAWVWWLVAARLVAELAGAPALELPLLKSKAPAAIPVWLAERNAAPGAIESAEEVSPVAEVAPPIPARHASVSGWGLVALGWLAGAAGAVAQLARQARRMRRLVERADPVSDPATIAALALARSRSGIVRTVDLRRSDEIAAPMVSGLLRPVVLLPAERELEGEDLALALEHELVHLRRGDAWRALVPAVASRLLFFHPLVRLAEREHRLATEAACDAEVLARDGAAPERYGRLLVRFAVSGEHAPSAAVAWSFAAPPILRRLDMMAQPSIDRRRLALFAPMLLALVIGLAVPLRLVAAPAPASTPSPTPEASPSPAASPAAEPTPEPQPAPVARAHRYSSRAGDRWTMPPVPPAPPAPGVAPMALPAPMPPMPPMAAMAPMAPMAAIAPMPPMPPLPAVSAFGEITAVDAMVLVDGDSHFSVDASRDEQRLAHRLADESGRPVALVRRDGRLLVIRDSKTLAEIQDAIESQGALARRQSDFAREQSGVARRQAELAGERVRRDSMRMQLQAEEEARRMAEQAREQAARAVAMSRELAALGQSPELAASEERLRGISQQLAQLERELDRLRERGSSKPAADEASTERLESELRAEVERIGDRNEALAREMSRQNEEIGRRISAALDRAFDAGLVEPLERPRR